MSVSHFRPLPQCPGGLPPPAGCKMHDSGKVSVKGGPVVWPCSCAARWRVHSGKPQSDSTCPLSPGCRMKYNCPGHRKYKFSESARSSIEGRYEFIERIEEVKAE